MEMRLKNLALRTLTVLILLTALVACDEDFQPVGKDLVDDINFNSDSILHPVVSYSKRLFGIQGVQTNNLASGALGIYTDPIYGTTRASHLSQVNPGSNNPSFGDEPVLDSVVFSMPYYSTASLGEEGETVYELDSVYGDDPINLKIYRSNYFLSASTPPDLEKSARYYSNQLNSLDGIEGDLLFDVPDFVPSNEGVVTVVPGETEDADSVRTVNPPLLRLVDTSDVGLAYWKQAIFDKEGDEVLFNGNTFKDYFRGVYLKAEALNSTDQDYFIFNRSGTNITLYYSYKNSNDIMLQGSYVLNFYGTGTTPNPIAFTGYTNDFNQSVTDALDPANIDMVNGEEDLYLRGGEGSTGVIQLFDPTDDDGDGIPDELNALRDRNLLIREANLILYVDQDKVSQYTTGAFAGPERIYLYDLKTNLPVVDYNTDASTGTTSALGSKINHLGPLTVDDDGNGVSYKIKLTQYLRNLLSDSNDNPTVTLGINVTNNVNITAVNYIEGTDEDDVPNTVSQGSLLYQEGTILHGNLSSDNDKKLVFRIYYTESE
ncbi:MAG: hypothetical protein CL868_12180 [Cytophagaceae bacterium]|nr:hypothetical protein [Cytophagaceae bacterium]|tara:strand:- start:8311 stop:9945 length:1635 start_codon:yes stop_codon:yes gene_type:complete